MPYKDYNAQMNIYMKKRWADRRSKAAAYLGGQCVKCGSINDLDFDHIEPSTKTMTVAKAASRSESFFWNEVKKCQLLCVPCHLEKSAADIRSGKVSLKRNMPPSVNG